MPTNTSPIETPKLLDQVRNKLRVKHYSIRTEQSYTDWIKRFILFHGKRNGRWYLLIMNNTLDNSGNVLLQAPPKVSLH